MSGVNRGKQFEEQIRQAFSNIPDTSIIRLPDPQNGFAGVCNVCDYIAYHYPNQYLVECKSCHGNTFGIYSNDSKHKYGLITNNQWEGMLENSKVTGIIAGVYLWFIDHDITLYIPIARLEKLRNAGYKSVNINKLEQLDGDYLILPGTKKRVLFDYDLHEFLGE